ncbi:hypothetical protein CJP72_23860 [Citrobacter sp. NCU1]|uniref:hypothetical protein n=1 Tax=Citrobacter sp. NCU1 TaxID=2026683 RepID=UPI001391FF8A|nr:hypothetical protein [Citrobacter sp. NCU1]NDO83672.1 hypothetical protein [Citrobacter sp. NCU1]
MGEMVLHEPNIFIITLDELELTEAVLDGDGGYYKGGNWRMDKDGYGLKKDTTVRRGENISSREAEGML